MAEPKNETSLPTRLKVNQARGLPFIIMKNFQNSKFFIEYLRFINMETLVATIPCLRTVNWFKKSNNNNRFRDLVKQLPEFKLLEWIHGSDLTRENWKTDVEGLQNIILKASQEMCPP